MTQLNNLTALKSIRLALTSEHNRLGNFQSNLTSLDLLDYLHGVVEDHTFPETPAYKRLQNAQQDMTRLNYVCGVGDTKQLLRCNNDPSY
jgi:hypothetical protein